MSGALGASNRRMNPHVGGEGAVERRVGNSMAKFGSQSHFEVWLCRLVAAILDRGAGRTAFLIAPGLQWYCEAGLGREIFLGSPPCFCVRDDDEGVDGPRSAEVAVGGELPIAGCHCHVSLAWRADLAGWVPQNRAGDACSRLSTIRTGQAIDEFSGPEPRDVRAAGHWRSRKVRPCPLPKRSAQAGRPQQRDQDSLDRRQAFAAREVRKTS
jgi:hypothetical protein